MTEDFEKKINYSFKNKALLKQAITHSSYAHENKSSGIMHNERLEFLGDAVLNITISEALYKGYPKLAEGQMTKARAAIVCEQSLGISADAIEIGKYLRLGRGEENTGGRKRVSVLSDAFEAIIGAIYIDNGIDEAKSFILRNLKSTMEAAVKGIYHLDYKTELQEAIQKSGENNISYEIVEEKGPAHDRIFVAEVRILNETLGTGEGRSKKEAEQNAAKMALEKLCER